MYADSSTITDHDDLFMETGIGGITVAGLRAPSSTSALLWRFSEAVKKTLQHNTETGSASAVLADYYSRPEGIADRAKLGHGGQVFRRDSAATPRGSPTSWTGQLRHSHGFSSRALREDYQDTLAVQAIMEDLARAVDGTTSYTDVSGGWPPAGTPTTRKPTTGITPSPSSSADAAARPSTRVRTSAALTTARTITTACPWRRASSRISVDGRSNPPTAPAARHGHTIQVIYAQATLRYAYLVDRDLADGRAWGTGLQASPSTTTSPRGSRRARRWRGRRR